MTSADPKDLIILVADKNQEYAVLGLLSRRDLGVRIESLECHVHPRRDPGCLRKSPEFLRSLSNQFRYAMVVLDHQGCGRDQDDPGALESEIESRLRINGWTDRAGAVVIHPELEAWVWTDSPVVEEALGWRGREDPLWAWLAAHGYPADPRGKPNPPKEAMEQVLRISRTPRSSSIYQRIAERVDFRRCRDRAFLKFLRTLRAWFPPA